MGKRYELVLDDTKIGPNGKTLFRIRALVAIGLLVRPGGLGGYIEREENLPHDGAAWVFPAATVCGRYTRLTGGTFWGGTFRGGTFRGGTFRGGTFRGGTFEGGTFWGGTFWGGTFWDGTFRGGTFEGGTFEGGTFEGGTFRGGTFTYALTAQRSDGYVFTINPTDEGVKIAAGCRYFTFAEAEAHWTATRAGTELGDETFAILAHLKRMAEIKGLLPAPATEESA